ncbi:hypothetical protein CRM22_008200 [Opisthorchis felineus]|uniref:Uncharacterized protein n=1 Tax=Opisthorchis felineus TaxID=147828 RepID=A0A4S2LC69_OPIFE|nr:hypothetical protein CRM22_008200 [Opisthorchis felineus]
MLMPRDEIYSTAYLAFTPIYENFALVRTHDSRSETREMATLIPLAGYVSKVRTTRAIFSKSTFLLISAAHMILCGTKNTNKCIVLELFWFRFLLPEQLNKTGSADNLK